MNDAELLKSYASTGSETAFDQLVERYLGPVFSTARRRLNDPCLAEEVTQSVFCLLAHHAHRLSYRETVAGWLYPTACLTAAKTLRDELRRRRKEETVVSNIPANSLSDETWASLEPLLEQAMDCLGEKDRLAILLRYYQKQSMREISLVLGSSEDAAKMRVNRAVEKLRAFFKKRGAAHTTAALTVLLAEHCVEAHPQNLAANTLSQVHASLLSGNIPTLSITTTWILMSTLKTKLLVGATTALALWFALGTAIYLTRPSWTSLTKSRDAMGLNTNNLTRPHRNSPQEKRGVIRTLASVAAAPLDYAARKALVTALHSPRPQGVASYPPMEVVMALELFGNQRVAALDILQEEFLSKDLEVRRRALSAMGRLGKGETAPREFLWQVLRSGDQELNSLAMNALINLDFYQSTTCPH